MLTIAVLVFAIGALGGLYMASRVLSGHFAPWAISLLTPRWAPRVWC